MDLKLILFERLFNIVNVVCLGLLSIGIYYLFVWVMNYMTFDHTYATIVMLHQTPIFYLTVLMCIGACFALDFFIAALEFNIFTTPTDFLRALVKNKQKIQHHLTEFNMLYQNIFRKYMLEDLELEKKLE